MKTYHCDVEYCDSDGSNGKAVRIPIRATDIESARQKAEEKVSMQDGANSDVVDCYKIIRLGKTVWTSQG